MTTDKNEQKPNLNLTAEETKDLLSFLDEELQGIELSACLAPSNEVLASLEEKKRRLTNIKLKYAASFAVAQYQEFLAKEEQRRNNQ